MPGRDRTLKAPPLGQDANDKSPIIFSSLSLACFWTQQHIFRIYPVAPDAYLWYNVWFF